MKRFAVALTMMLCLLSLARAEVIIPKEFHVENEEPGYCMWCSLEVIGRQQKVKRLFNLKEKRKQDRGFYVQNGFGGLVWMHQAGGHPIAVQAKLRDLGVSYRMQWPGMKNTAIIRDALKENHPVVVSVGHGWHVVVLTHMDDESVKYIDSNHPGAVVVQTRDWFLDQWDGYVVEILDGP